MDTRPLNQSPADALTEPATRTPGRSGSLRDLERSVDRSASVSLSYVVPIPICSPVKCPSQGAMVGTRLSLATTVRARRFDS